jgi:hypothetical protein
MPATILVIEAVTTAITDAYTHRSGGAVRKAAMILLKPGESRLLSEKTALFMIDTGRSISHLRG